MPDIHNTAAWSYFDESMQDLLLESYYLLEREVTHLREPGILPLHDYSFVVFPAAKAYEGFLKKVFLDLKFINKAQYVGDRFRIGRALNPNLPVRYRHDWVFAKLTQYCAGEGLPRQLWETWKTARNGVFHFFPGHSRFVSLTEAQALLELIVSVMNQTLAGCRLA